MAQCSPNDDAARVLVAATYEARNGSESFTAQQVNGQLKHLGHRVDNITRAIDQLMAQRPAPVVQLKKQGTTRQARKVYKVTETGLRQVERMSHGEV